MWVLKRPDKCPPGNYSYEQTVGIYRKFAATSDLDALAYQIWDFRKANNLPGATLEECYNDAQFYKCRQLGFMKEYCYDTENKPYTAPIIAARQGCGGCGARVS